MYPSLHRAFALLMRPLDVITRRHRIVAHLLLADSRILRLEEKTALLEERADRLEGENWRLERMQLAASDFYERRLDLIYRNVSLLHRGEASERSSDEAAGRKG